MSIVIEKGIPLPNRAGVVEAVYPFEAMEVNDSFASTESQKNVASKTRRANLALAPKRFTTRRIDGGYRIWRIQ